MSKTKNKWLLVAGIGITLSFFLLAIIRIDLSKAYEAGMSGAFVWLLPITFLQIIMYYFRAIRWRYIMVSSKKTSIGNLYSAISIGLMGNMILPFRIGEVIRAYVIAKKERLVVSEAFGTIVIERAFDMLSALVMLVVVLTTADIKSASGEVDSSIRSYGILFTGLIIAAFFFIHQLSRKDSLVGGIILYVMKILPGNVASAINGPINSFRTGLQVIKSRGRLVAITFYSAIIWYINILVFKIFLYMFGLESSMEAATTIILFVIIGVMIPSSPGFVGPFHAGVIVGLGLYGINVDSALGYAVVIHFVSFALTVLIGLFFLWREKFTFTEIWHSADME
ncbi:hypothetical protein MNBD_NITROSPINAE02-1759 [hydrothermal vent metagenome]|uniref:Dolichol-P-glucose synthetase n=1 Tax=hydrothermal vent metagenome TaxID=652676 RepID=A0A3B1CIA0_9ZZZZ